jgi:hypothetical protein
VAEQPDSRLEILEELQLRMQAGDLRELSREQREAVFAPHCDSDQVTGLVDASLRNPRATTKRLERVEEFSKLLAEGRVLGHELVQMGHPKVLAFEQVPFIYEGKPSLRGQYSMATDDAVNELILDHIFRRIGEFNKGSWRGTWHGVNVALFLIALISGGVARGRGDEGLFAQFLFTIWLISVSAMLIVPGNTRFLAKSVTTPGGYLAQVPPLARPLREGVEAELFEAEAAQAANHLRVGRKQRRALSEEEKRIIEKRARERLSQERLRQSEERLERARAYVRSLNSTRGSSSTSGGYQYSSSKRAEELCAEWLRRRGDSSAAVTQDGADGGLDIRSNKYVGQVKNYRGTVPVQAIREIHGIAAAENRKAIFFTSGRYTKAAVDFAESVDMPLITYNALSSDFKGANGPGRMFL